MSLLKYSLPKSPKSENNKQNPCNFQKYFVSLQRERRNQVEPRCAERWHLRDDEQFDLAAWFPSLIYSWSRVGQLSLYLDIALTIELFLICTSGSCDEVDKFHYFSTHLHLIVWMNNEL